MRRPNVEKGVEKSTKVRWRGGGSGNAFQHPPSVNGEGVRRINTSHSVARRCGKRKDTESCTEQQEHRTKARRADGARPVSGVGAQKTPCRRLGRADDYAKGEGG